MLSCFIFNLYYLMKQQQQHFIFCANFPKFLYVFKLIFFILEVGDLGFSYLIMIKSIRLKFKCKHNLYNWMFAVNVCVIIYCYVYIILQKSTWLPSSSHWPLCSYITFWNRLTLTTSFKIATNSSYTSTNFFLSSNIIDKFTYFANWISSVSESMFCLFCSLIPLPFPEQCLV